MNIIEKIIHFGHKIEIVEIEGRNYEICRKCETYVPSLPVGRCPICKKLMVCGAEKVTCRSSLCAMRWQKKFGGRR